MSRSAVRPALAIELAMLTAFFAVSAGLGAPQPGDRGAGACCTPEGCIMADEEYICVAVFGGVWFPGEVCVEAGGNFECPELPGACCTELLECISGLTQELCTLLYPNATWYVGETCVEAGGTFVCPSTVTGACCTEYGCYTLTQTDCQTWYGNAPWFEGEDCAVYNPCPPIQGACCLRTGCITTDQDTCYALAGGPASWYRGETCVEQGGEFVCPGCPDESLFCQQPQSGDNGMTWVASDTVQTQYVYERFWGLTGDICGVRWFGVMAREMEPCENGVTSFIVRFFEVGEDMMPGTQVAIQQFPIDQVQVTLHPEWSEQIVPLVMSEYVIEFDDCIPLHDGYISIVAVGSEQCWFSFLISYEGYYPTPEGDNAFCGYTPWLGLQCGRAWQVHDLPIQLFGPDIPGACCDDVTGTCSVVMPADCRTGRFEAGVACEDLVPPCGGMAGACCSETEPCHLAYAKDCAGAYAGDGTTCDAADCNSNGRGDACDIALGHSPDCNSNGVPDECDVAAGTSADYDGNAVPDECDADRNGNGVPDACDLDCSAGNCANHPLGCGGSTDCQGDGVPDDAQLGTLGNRVLWDNGAPVVEPLDPMGGGYTSSQEGGEPYYLPTIVIDDFIIPANGAAINGIEFYTETSPDFAWTGRVHLKVFANRAYRSPEGAQWQLDGDPQNATIDIWLPDAGGTVARAYDGDGYHYDRYKWTISDVDLHLAPGPWFMGISVEASGATGLSYPCYSHTEAADILRSEAWYYWANVDAFQPLQTWVVPLVDIAFVLLTDFYGADDNHNGIPDECDATLVGDLNCDGVVSFGDINPFVLILSSLPAWQQMYPACPVLNGDINQDRSVNFGDINPFVTLLTQ